MRAALVLCCLLLLPVAADAQRHKSKIEHLGRAFSDGYNYEVETVGVGTEGTKALKVWAYGRDVEEAVDMAKKAAVAACIFRGLPASTYALSTPALCTDYDHEWDDYFDAFFASGGDYLDYINLTSDGDPSGQDRLKMKNGYKVAIYVQVLYDNLRRHLEKTGVIKSLNSYF